MVEEKKTEPKKEFINNELRNSWNMFRTLALPPLILVVFLSLVSYFFHLNTWYFLLLLIVLQILMRLYTYIKKKEWNWKETFVRILQTTIIILGIHYLFKYVPFKYSIYVLFSVILAQSIYNYMRHRKQFNQIYMGGLNKIEMMMWGRVRDTPRWKKKKEDDDGRKQSE